MLFAAGGFDCDISGRSGDVRSENHFLQSRSGWAEGRQKYEILNNCGDKLKTEKLYFTEFNWSNFQLNLIGEEMAFLPTAAYVNYAQLAHYKETFQIVIATIMFLANIKVCTSRSNFSYGWIPHEYLSYCSHFSYISYQENY